MKKIILNFLVIFLIPTSIVLIEGCYPNNDITIADSDVVLTSFNDSVPFTNLKTYYMPDTVVPFVDPNSPDEYKNPYQAIMLSTVASNMASYGYQRIDNLPGGPTADVVVVLSVMTTTTVNAGWYYPYYGWGYWGWYYPYFPPQAYYTSYSTGTLLINMFNPEDYTISGADTTAVNYWAAVSNGILESGATAMQNRIEAMINQAFVQTPQIKTN
jgi:hypothetical protein